MTSTTRLLGQYDVDQAAGTRRLAATLHRKTATGESGTPPSQGVIVAVDVATPPTCEVSFDDGDNAHLRHLASYTPTVGDVVEVMWRSGDPFILGVLA